MLQREEGSPDNCRNHIMILDAISQIVLHAGCAVNWVCSSPRYWGSVCVDWSWKRTFAKILVSQSRRRPLLGPSSGWKHFYSTFYSTTHMLDRHQPLNEKVLGGAFYQEKALVRAFSMSVKNQSSRRFVCSSSVDCGPRLIRSANIPTQWQYWNDGCREDGCGWSVARQQQQH